MGKGKNQADNLTIVRQIARIESVGDFAEVDMPPNSRGERVYVVWFDNKDFDYVWAKDELHAYQNVMQNEANLTKVRNRRKK